ncbi:MAG: hypothetical protein ACYDB7_05045 [Mycobacteriales bacterium]
MPSPGTLLITCWLALTDRVSALFVPRQRERGDVPGWVMVTIMTAAVVVVLIPFVGPIIAKAFSHAVSSVTNTPSSTQ